MRIPCPCPRDHERFASKDLTSFSSSTPRNISATTCSRKRQGNNVALFVFSLIVVIIIMTICVIPVDWPPCASFIAHVWILV